MPTETAPAPGPVCTVEVLPPAVDGGTEFALVIRILDAADLDLSGQTVSILDRDGKQLAVAALVRKDDGGFAVDSVTLKAPEEPGEFRGRVVLRPNASDGNRSPEISAPFSVAVRPHGLRVQVWGMPTAIAAGEAFTMRVGVKCTSACSLAGREVTLVDHAGAGVSTAPLLAEPAPGTEALYYAELKALAPPTPGSHRWRAIAPATTSGVAHDGGEASFSLRVVDKPDHEIAVEVFDIETGKPINGMHVMLHPYRGTTGNDGSARIKVVGGSYKLYISGRKYLPYENIVDANANVSLRADMMLEPARDPYLD